METIRLLNKNAEIGAQIVMTNGTVIYTGKKGEIKVPRYVLDILDSHDVAYELVEHHENGAFLA